MKTTDIGEGEINMTFKGNSQGMIIRLILLSVIGIVCAVCITGCSGSDVTDQVANVAQAEDEHILSVKNGTNSEHPNTTYGEAFDSYFGSPAWKYFKGTKEGTDEDGDGKPDSETKNVDIVEFTGYCMYKNVEVKALVQFTLNDDDTFSATYLSYNEVPQNLLQLAGLIESVFNDGSSDDNNSETTTTEEQNEVQTEEIVESEQPEDSYIIPDSDKVRITQADLQSYLLSLQETNYAKNEIYARHGRKFKSKELQDYFNSKSWYIGTIEPEDFNEEELLSEVERDNIRLLNDAEFSMDPNGYKLDSDGADDVSDSDFDERWYRKYSRFMMYGASNWIEFITYDFDDFVDLAVNGVTIDDFEPDSYYYDIQWGAYIYITSNGISFGYKPDENKILIISGDYIGEYVCAD